VAAGPPRSAHPAPRRRTHRRRRPAATDPRRCSAHRKPQPPKDVAHPAHRSGAVGGAPGRPPTTSIPAAALGAGEMVRGLALAETTPGP
jgi:hypothetical protein